MADLEGRGIPTVGVATTEFIEGAAAQAKSLGIDPALVFVPHPVQDRTDDELKKLADDHLEPILAMLVKSGGSAARSLPAELLTRSRNPHLSIWVVAAAKR